MSKPSRTHPWRASDPMFRRRGAAVSRRDWRLKWKFGITEQAYVELLATQRGVCAICKQRAASGKALGVDHDHSCCPGKRSCGLCVRGLLCSNCNTLLGLAQDSAEVVRAAEQYLTFHKARANSVDSTSNTGSLCPHAQGGVFPAGTTQEKMHNE